MKNRKLKKGLTIKEKKNIFSSHREEENNIQIESEFEFSHFLHEKANNPFVKTEI